MVQRTLIQVMRGFAMGAADVVPGVSGGTIALVLGIYTALIAQVRQGARVLGRIVRGDVKGGLAEFRDLDFWFLLPLLGGIALAFVTLAGIITTQLEERPQLTAAVFFGLVLGSLWVAWEQLQIRDTQRMVTLGVAAVVTFLVLGVRGSEQTDPALWFLLIAGSIAICAMILPGISGSFILLMLGVYEFVLDAIHDRDLAVIAVVGVGAITGLALFSSVLDWALRTHGDTMLAGLVGLMAGSLRVLWPWPDGTDSSTLGSPPSGDIFPALLLAFVAATFVIGLSVISTRLPAKRPAT